LADEITSTCPGGRPAAAATTALEGGQAEAGGDGGVSALAPVGSSSGSGGTGRERRAGEGRRQGREVAGLLRAHLIAAGRHWRATRSAEVMCVSSSEATTHWLMPASCCEWRAASAAAGLMPAPAATGAGTPATGGGAVPSAGAAPAGAAAAAAAAGSDGGLAGSDGAPAAGGEGGGGAAGASSPPLAASEPPCCAGCRGPDAGGAGAGAAGAGAGDAAGAAAGTGTDAGAGAGRGCCGASCFEFRAAGIWLGAGWGAWDTAGAARAGAGAGGAGACCCGGRCCAAAPAAAAAAGGGCSPAARASGCFPLPSSVPASSSPPSSSPSLSSPSPPSPSLLPCLPAAGASAPRDATGAAGGGGPRPAGSCVYE
jgi:hypothetical protein